MGTAGRDLVTLSKVPFTVKLLGGQALNEKPHWLGSVPHTPKGGRTTLKELLFICSPRTETLLKCNTEFDLMNTE